MNNLELTPEQQEAADWVWKVILNSLKEYLNDTGAALAEDPGSQREQLLAAYAYVQSKRRAAGLCDQGEDSDRFILRQHVVISRSDAA